MLSVTGLVNYIGKVELPLSDVPADGIAVRPVLLRKGNTHLGLYGIGNVKDARMHFELRSNRVRMYMPKDKSDWFNLLLLHQNRYGMATEFQYSNSLTWTHLGSNMDHRNPFRRASSMIASISSSGATNMTVALLPSRLQGSDTLFRSLVHPLPLPSPKARHWISTESSLLLGFPFYGANSLCQDTSHY
jgi:DNA repair exonuclease SbcCD nuclease subunit